jgi:phenylpyruvate tautomerase PptA (4-oxalocrotonate tautomerase family)
VPLVRIDMLEGRSAQEREQIADCTHRAMVETLGVPERDRFQIVTEHTPGSLHFDRGYLDIERSDAFVLVGLTLASGRSAQVKQAFYARLCELLVQAVGLRPQDLAVCLVENEREDWSFGNGEASYLTIPKDRWR